MRSTFNVRDADLRTLNSLTKYPSIPTYHRLDTRDGTLHDDATAFPGEVIATEKVDGTSSRVILLPDGTYLIGSREELLHAQGDLVANPALGIVEQLRSVADGLCQSVGHDEELIRVFFLELYGGKIGAAAKQYTSDPTRFGWRLFDVAFIDGWAERSAWPAQRISAWRDSAGQPFLTEDELEQIAKASGLELTPRLFRCPGSELPTGLSETHALLRERLLETLVGLDQTGRPEGMVFRTLTRSVIAKARFQDYERTLRRRS